MTSAMPRDRLIIAIDGPSGSGKSTVARAVARRLGLRYLDTGALYRATTWAVLERALDVSDEAAVAALLPDLAHAVSADPDAPAISVLGVDVTDAIRGEAVTAAVSAVAALPAVRAHHLALQRAVIGAGGVVVEGRDIGTTVAPEAPVKIFLNAHAAVRAQRRAEEFANTDRATTERDLARRDAHDSTRTTSPLAKADDAVEIDASELDVDQVVERVLDLVEQRAAR